MVGKMAITASFQMIIFFSGELFPTEVRSRGVSTAVMMSRLGSMGAPFITDLVGSMYPWAPFVIFGSGALLAGAGTFLLPETRGQVLPDTVAHLEVRERCVANFFCSRSLFLSRNLHYIYIYIYIKYIYIYFFFLFFFINLIH
ncbi:Solute carrier family 22 member 6 [Chionoecetes opilio]|uniref:Solute carrier family 22 member 6 n=1 Tax=Chionoecetes opilio TaxID=41210 RepID=A0A8J5CLS7_CHIOP|nr:Solute carrier family 22 member 6 [Chionoecetes opilio]